jgi:hypothetical protein
MNAGIPRGDICHIEDETNRRTVRLNEIRQLLSNNGTESEGKRAQDQARTSE